MILRVTKFTLWIIFFLSVTNCIGIVHGDFSMDQISKTGKNIEFSSLEYVNCEPLGFGSEIPFDGIKINPKNQKLYMLQIHHTIPKDYTNDMAVLITIMSLGILPFFHTMDAMVEYTILANNQPVLQEKDILKVTFFYGWILTFSMDYFKSPNLISVNEGTGLRGALESALYNRLGYRVQKKMSEKKLSD